MNLTDTKSKRKHLNFSNTQKIKKKENNCYSTSTQKKSRSLRKALKQQKLEILRLEAVLFSKTQPRNLKYTGNSFQKEIIELYKKIEAVKQPITETPATVGDYFEKHLKN